MQNMGFYSFRLANPSLISGIFQRFALLINGFEIQSVLMLKYNGRCAWLIRALTVFLVSGFALAAFIIAKYDLVLFIKSV